MGFGTEPGSLPSLPASRGRMANVLLISLALALPIAAAEPLSALGDGVQLRCVQASETRLKCDYRLTQPAPVAQVLARINGITLPAPETAEGGSEVQSAILVLVDTGDAARRPAVEKSIAHIHDLIDAARPQHRIGLAAFDRNFHLLAAIGEIPEVLHAKASAINAGGRTTELYRTTLEAVRVLDQAPAHRRALIILSDGLAEDRAYFHHDVVAAAHNAGIAIFGIGYPRSVPLSVGLQTLRRLAEETGGLYADTGETFALPPGFLRRVLESIDNGGQVSVNLEAAAEAGLIGEQTLELEFVLSDGRASAALPVTLPGGDPQKTVVKVVEVKVPTLVEVPVPVANGAATIAPASSAGSTRYPSATTVWIWYVLLPAVLLVALVVILLLNLRTRRAERDDLTSTGPSKAARSLAYLEALDGSSQRHAVTNAAYRIGRHSDNDLTIRDESISRQHAEIHRRRDGSFTITDLDSMNGVFVNQKKIDSVKISDGDIIEIGDKSFRFRMKAQSDPGGAETVSHKAPSPVSRLPNIADRR